jgi:hypothetical protein
VELIRPSNPVRGEFPELSVAVDRFFRAPALPPGEFAIQFWREAGLIHPAFAKRAVASVTSNLARKKPGQLRESDLVKLDPAPGLWFGL